MAKTESYKMAAETVERVRLASEASAVKMAKIIEAAVAAAFDPADQDAAAILEYVRARLNDKNRRGKR